MFGHVRRTGRQVGRFDQELMLRSAALPRSRADDALKALSRSANKGRLWFALAALLAARKGATRRGALRGVAAIGIASASANLVGKNLFPRRRPAAELLPEHRRLTKRPTSSSFPSGHSASAVAFTAAVAMEHPGAAIALAPVAAAVAYSRTHTGVHWPTDIAAGAAIGVGAAFATRHWWPKTHEGPAHVTESVRLAALEDGDGLLVLVNPHSGVSGTDPTDEIKASWPRATVVYPEPGRDLVEQLTEELTTSPGDIKAVGVAGGDGTVAAVASVAAEYELPLVLIPAGTLNHFARDVGVESTSESVEAVAAGTGVRIDLGYVDISGTEGGSHRWFINTASLGGYPEMVRLRERLEARNWPKWPAGALALIRTLRRAQPIRLELNGKAHLVWMLFVGSGSYAPKGFAPTRRPALDTGLLDVRYLRADLPYSRFRFVIGTLTRTLDTSHVYRQRDLPSLRVRLLDGYRRIATDGEVGPLASEFEFSARPNALAIYRAPTPG
ncbi:bifunctional phosphatase PAP2/diacylglycerol kinase family protein [Actinokineospora globicatena]|uniref:bifunctional phosphatase PAP2/diacylglycerol kinase family protein n=1 Tax=Actinokineospora globicatena TaxID=103729 RepID=UPI0020A60B75|nr:bifunctional phosphatase PAP2/diacylglycerol kinase family protein [Actinokineospora globicatena]GLW82237.1 glycerophosphatase [Actinokineospora globicatena]GLW89030.1 glycerophosphatase [Actinokineospora globicatena]